MPNSIRVIILSALGTIIAIALLCAPGCLQIPKEDKEMIQSHIIRVEDKVGGLTEELKDLNAKLGDLKNLGKSLEEMNSYLDRASGADAQGQLEDYKTGLQALIEQLKKLNANIESADSGRHTDSEALLGAIKRLEEKFNGMFGGNK